MAPERLGTGELDAVVVGGGWNGLACATVLARAGLAVALVEDRPALGGTHRTEYPFSKAPRLATHPGEHRVGFVPPDLAMHLGAALPTAPRVPGIFVPTLAEGRFLLGPADDVPVSEGLTEADARALRAMHAELDAIVADLGPVWTRPGVALDEIAGRHVRPALREAFVHLCKDSFAAYAARFGLRSGLLRAALAVDALGDTFASIDTPGGGGALLVRHAARRHAAPVAGFGRALVEAAQASGVLLVAGQPIAQIVIDGNNVSGIVLADGTVQRASAVVTSADPWRLRALVGANRFGASPTRRVDALAQPGGIAKLTLALDALPRFTSLPEDRGQHRATTFLVPQSGGEDDAVRALVRAHAEAAGGHLPVAPGIECVFSTAQDESLRDAEGRHSLSLLVPWVPYDLGGTTWAAEEDRFTNALVDTLEAFAPGTKTSIVDAVLWHPKKLESHFGVTRGHLGQVDDTVLFGDRMRPGTPVNGLYSCARACGPAGGVVGAAGVVAANKLIEDLELALERTEIGQRS